MVNRKKPIAIKNLNSVLKVFGWQRGCCRLKWFYLPQRKLSYFDRDLFVIIMYL